MALLDELSFEVCDALVREADVVTRCRELRGQGLPFGSQFTDLPLQVSVVRDDPHDVVFGQAAAQVADLSDELGDLLLLGEDLGVSSGDRGLGVQGAFAPGRFEFVPRALAVLRP